MAYVGFAVANPAHYRVMFGSALGAKADDAKAIDCDLVDEAEGAFQALVDALAALQRDAIVRDEDTVTMARFVWSVVHGVAMLGIDGQLARAGRRRAVDALRYRASAHRHRGRRARRLGVGAADLTRTRRYRFCWRASSSISCRTRSLIFASAAAKSSLGAGTSSHF